MSHIFALFFLIAIHSMHTKPGKFPFWSYSYSCSVLLCASLVWKKTSTPAYLAWKPTQARSMYNDDTGAIALFHSSSSVAGIPLWFIIIQSLSVELRETRILSTKSLTISRLRELCHSILTCLGEKLGTVLMAQDYRAQTDPRSGLWRVGLCGTKV